VESVLRPREEVFNMQYQAPSSAKPVMFNGKKYTDQTALGTDIKKAYHLRSTLELTSCETCHR
jgi:hypothetical protein